MKITDHSQSAPSQLNTSQNDSLPSESTYTRWRFAFALLLVLWITVTSTLRGALQSKFLFDFEIFYGAAVRLSEGKQLYVPMKFGESVYNQSPFPAIAFLPLTHFTVEQASRMWTVFSVLVIVASIVVFAQVLKLRWQDTVSGIILIVTTFYFWPTVIDFSAGQINYILLFLLCVLYWCDTRSVASSAPQEPSQSVSSDRNAISRKSHSFWASKSKRDIAIAAVIVLMSMTKTWCIGLILLYILRKRFRVVGITLGLYLLAMLALFSYIGFHQFNDFMAVTRVSSSQTWLVSYSLSGFTRLYFADNYLNINPIIDNIWVYRLFLLMGFLLVARGLWTIFRHGEPRSPLEARLQLGFVVSSILLLTPLCHIAYFQLCLPLLWTFLAASLLEKNAFTPWTLIGAIAIYISFTRPWPNFQALVDYQTFPRSLLISIPFFTNFALWLLTWKSLHRLRSEN